MIHPQVVDEFDGKLGTVICSEIGIDLGPLPELAQVIEPMHSQFHCKWQ